MGKNNFTMTDKIIKTIIASTRPIDSINTLPAKQGIYAFAIIDTDDLGKFGASGQVIYVGISNNLNGREMEQHLSTGQTGWSTLRRSIGAILKVKLNLTAIKRDINGEQIRADKYKFDDYGETKLTAWMKANLKLGFWTADNSLSDEQLRSEEENVILKLKPTLDLDKRTRKFNLLADELDQLRNICREQVKNKLSNYVPQNNEKTLDEFNQAKRKKVVKEKKEKKGKTKSVRAILTDFESNRSRH